MKAKRKITPLDLYCNHICSIV